MISRCKTIFYQMITMLINTTDQIIGYAGIQLTSVSEEIATALWASQ